MVSLDQILILNLDIIVAYKSFYFGDFVGGIVFPLLVLVLLLLWNRLSPKPCPHKPTSLPLDHIPTQMSAFLISFQS